MNILYNAMLFSLFSASTLTAFTGEGIIVIINGGKNSTIIMAPASHPHRCTNAKEVALRSAIASKIHTKQISARS